MENNFEDINDKYSEEDINFFNALAEKYDLEQNADQLIIVREDNSRVFFLNLIKYPQNMVKLI